MSIVMWHLVVHHCELRDRGGDDPAEGSKGVRGVEGLVMSGVM